MSGKHGKCSKLFSSSCQENTESVPNFSAQKQTEGCVLTCFRVFGALGQFGETGPNRAQLPEIMVRETQKVIQSLQVIISHQVRPYLSVMTN